MKKITLIDGKNLVFRSHFSHRHLQDSQGRPTSVLHGFLSSLLDLEKKLGQSDIIVLWDNGHPLKEKHNKTQLPIWRKTIMRSEYKANRVPNDDTKIALRQIPRLAQILEVIGVLQVGVPTLEADDLIGLACGLYRADPKASLVMIYSNDRDHFQLVGDKVMIAYPTKRGLEILDEEQIQKATGVWPWEWAQYKALVGDASDNYKALKGVGPKTALSYLRAGLDPSVPQFRNLPKQVRSRFAGLEHYWPEVHKCYILSLIPTTPNFPHFPSVCSEDLGEAMRDLRKKRTRKFKDQELDSRLGSLIGYLSDHDLTELLARKREFLSAVETY